MSLLLFTASSLFVGIFLLLLPICLFVWLVFLSLWWQCETCWRQCGFEAIRILYLTVAVIPFVCSRSTSALVYRRLDSVTVKQVGKFCYWFQLGLGSGFNYVTSQKLVLLEECEKFCVHWAGTAWVVYFDVFENACFFSFELLSRINQVQKYYLQEKLLLGMYLTWVENSDYFPKK